MIKRNPPTSARSPATGRSTCSSSEYEKALEYFKRALVVNPNMESVESAVRVLEHVLAERKKTI